MKTQKTALLVVIATLLLAMTALVGCTGGATGASATKPAEKPAADASAEAPAETPTLAIAEPVAGATVAAGELEVDSTVENLTFTMPSNANVAGEGHIHYTLDDRPFEMSTTPGMVIKDVEPGEHTLVAELVQNNTQPFDPPIKHEITFIAK